MKGKIEIQQINKLINLPLQCVHTLVINPAQASLTAPIQTKARVLECWLVLVDKRLPQLLGRLTEGAVPQVQ